MSDSNHKELIAEMRSAAKTLRVDGIDSTVTNKLSAELLDRAADALATAYTPAQMAESFRAGLATARMQNEELGENRGN